jgi:hypothetical protein
MGEFLLDVVLETGSEKLGCTTSPVTIETDPAIRFPTGSQQVPNRFGSDSEQTQNRLSLF